MIRALSGVAGFLINLFSTAAVAATVTEDFTTAAHFSATSTAVWNLVAHRVQVPFAASHSSTAPILEDAPFPIGRGTDGALGPETYASFDLGGGPVGTITLEARTYEFTTVTLAPGTKIRAAGARPLEFRVQGDFTLGANASIDVSGGDGALSTAGAATCCGGANGGAGGAASAVGNNGASADSGHTGGGGGGAAGGGGGGGGFTQAGAAATGTAGAAYGDIYLGPDLGASGGGGGGGSALTGGGGGGAGGGLLRIYVGGNFVADATATILAKGGIGGGGGTGGCGGGGAGGGILVFAGGTSTGGGGTHSFTAEQGPAGTGTCTSAGGNGADGATWDLALGGWNGQDPYPPIFAIDFGRAFYVKRPVVVESTAYDTGLGNPVYEGAQAVDSPNGGTIVYEFAAAGTADFVPAAGDWVARADLARLNGKRYFRFRATLTGASFDASPTISQIAVSSHLYVPGFAFNAGCASVHSDDYPTATKVMSLWWLLLAFALPAASRHFGRLARDRNRIRRATSRALVRSRVSDRSHPT